eukprot:12407883-Karenia_brevis.AAC.1
MMVVIAKSNRITQKTNVDQEEEDNGDDGEPPEPPEGEPPLPAPSEPPEERPPLAAPIAKKPNEPKEDESVDPIAYIAPIVLEDTSSYEVTMPPAPGVSIKERPTKTGIEWRAWLPTGEPPFEHQKSKGYQWCTIDEYQSGMQREFNSRKSKVPVLCSVQNMF